VRVEQADRVRAAELHVRLVHQHQPARLVVDVRDLVKREGRARGLLGVQSTTTAARLSRAARMMASTSKRRSAASGTDTTSPAFTSVISR
jgi:hypothetical protein